MQNDAEHLFAEVQRLDQLLQLALNGAAAGTAALTRVPDFAQKQDVKGVLPGQTVVVGAVDVSKVQASAFQVQFVAEDTVAPGAASVRFTDTVQGGAAPLESGAVPLVPQVALGTLAVAPVVFTLALVGTQLVASVTNNAAAPNPINVRANFYADIESF